MTTREFTVTRRKANFLDILTPKRPGIQGYRFRGSQTFDGVFNDILTADISSGFLDPAIDRRVITPLPGTAQTHIRVVFDPQTFNGSAGLVDIEQFWLTFRTVDFAGALGTESAPGLILPAGQHGAGGRVMIEGTAPNLASLALALQLDLPRRMSDFRITNNDATNSLFVATARTGGELEVVAGVTQEWLDGAADTLFVRGDGAGVPFTANFTNYLPL